MKEYCPKPDSHAWAAINLLDEEGAQYATELATRLRCNRKALKGLLAGPVRHGALGHERRKRGGHSENIWFITPKAYPVIERMREVAA